ncbi:MAG: tetratricopeptide repeat protein [Carnobacterium sp.]
MGEKIEFPKSYEAYINKGLEYFELGNMEEAATYFEVAYAIKQEPRINSFYATALYQNGDYKKAKTVADKEINYYNSEDNLTLFYVSILIKGHYFIQAEKIIKNKLTQTNDNDSKWHAQYESIEKEKAEVLIANKKRYERIMKNVFSMGNQSFEEQARTFKDVTEMPIPQFVKAATSLLSNPFVNGVVKTTVIEYLIEKKIENTFVLEWFGEQRIIKPIDMLPVMEVKAVQEIELLLKETIENEDPVLFQAISQEANLHFMLLYPFIDEVIESPSQWIALYLERYDQVHEVSTKKSASFDSITMEKWMHRVNEVIQTWI